MDFADITYSIPQANIFSGLEPSIAVIIACVPLMRPLFGRSEYSKDGSGQYVQESGMSRSEHRVNKDDRDFEPLSDDSSQYRLRPMGTKFQAGVTVEERGVRPPGSSDTSDAEEAARITVRQEWNVSDTPAKQGMAL